MIEEVGLASLARAFQDLADRYLVEHARIRVGVDAPHDGLMGGRCLLA